MGKCIDLTSNEKLDMEVAFDDECMPLVKLPHMMRAIREGMPMRHVDVICGLPQAAKVVLCIAVSLSQVWGPTAEISISILKKYCVEATHHCIMNELGPGHLMSLVDMLIDSGLLVTGKSGQFNPHDPNAKLKIGVQLDDVEIALEQSLLKKGGFYKNLVDHVKHTSRVKKRMGKENDIMAAGKSLPLHSCNVPEKNNLPKEHLQVSTNTHQDKVSRENKKNATDSR